MTPLEYLAAAALLAILLGLAVSCILQMRPIRSRISARQVHRACRNAKRRAAERREQAERFQAWWGGGRRG